MLTAVATVGCCRSQSSGRPKVLSSKQQNFTLEGEARCVDLFLKSCPGIPWSHVPKLTCTSSVAPVVLILRTVYKLQFLCCSWHILLKGLKCNVVCWIVFFRGQRWGQNLIWTLLDFISNLKENWLGMALKKCSSWVKRFAISTTKSDIKRFITHFVKRLICMLSLVPRPHPAHVLDPRWGWFWVWDLD